MIDGHRSWVAGIIDGEGSISVRNQRRGKNNRPHYVLIVAVGNTDLAMVKKLRVLCGGWIQKKRVLPSGKTFYRWTVTCQVAWRLLEEIRAFLVTKRERARVAILFGRRVSNFVGYQTNGGGYKGLNGARLTKREEQIREEFISQMRTLNA